jgi:hypothetical protein
MMMVHWPAMMMPQAVVRVHVAMMVVRRVMRHRCPGGLAERRRQRDSRYDERRNELTSQQHGVSSSAQPNSVAPINSHQGQTCISLLNWA